MQLLFLQALERHVLQCFLMGGLEPQRWGHACLVGFTPTDRTQTPLVAGFEAWKSVAGLGGGKIIAFAFGVFQKLICHRRADHVLATVVGSGVAMAIAVVARERLCGTNGQVLPVHVFLGWSFGL